MRRKNTQEKKPLWANSNPSCWQFNLFSSSQISLWLLNIYPLDCKSSIRNKKLQLEMYFMLLFLVWHLRLQLVTSIIVGSQNSFTDTFETDTELWNNDSGELRCIDYHCVFCSRENVKKRESRNINWEELKLTNDCYGKWSLKIFKNLVIGCFGDLKKS